MRQPHPEFTPSQQKAYDSMMAGRSVFLTGFAGTGKSYLLKSFIGDCPRSMVVTAPTGIAALNLPKGQTIHRAFKIPPKPVFEPDARFRLNDLLRAAECLIIDEVSMCRIDLFGVVARMSRYAKIKQIVVVGDFFQLPPVIREDDKEILDALYPGNVNGFCFSGQDWDNIRFETHVLTEPVRQKDPVFLEALNAIRIGDSSKLSVFDGHVVDEPENDSIVLTPHNRDADEINKKALENIDGDEIVFRADVIGDVKKSDMAAPQTLHLKVGCRVMSLVNDTNGHYQNGSMGIVRDIEEETYYSPGSVVVEFDNGRTCRLRPNRWDISRSVAVSNGNSTRIEQKTIGAFSQIPLRNANAITIHKSQGQTFDKVTIAPDCFAPGQLYVALSRCTTLDGIFLLDDIPESALMADEGVKGFYGIA